LGANYKSENSQFLIFVNDGHDYYHVLAVRFKECQALRANSSFWMSPAPLRSEGHEV